MHEILPGLWLGSLSQLDAFESRPTDMIVNCTKDLTYAKACSEMLRVPVDDDLSTEAQETMAASLGGVVRAMHAAREGGHRVLVHCKQGQQRSACVVAAYVMATLSLSVSEAIAYVQTKKRDAFFWRANFKPALESFATRAARGF